MNKVQTLILHGEKHHPWTLTSSIIPIFEKKYSCKIKNIINKYIIIKAKSTI